MDLLLVPWVGQELGGGGTLIQVGCYSGFIFFEEGRLWGDSISSRGFFTPRLASSGLMAVVQVVCSDC